MSPSTPTTVASTASALQNFESAGTSRFYFIDGGRIVAVLGDLGTTNGPDYPKARYLGTFGYPVPIPPQGQASKDPSPLTVRVLVCRSGELEISGQGLQGLIAQIDAVSGEVVLVDQDGNRIPEAKTDNGASYIPAEYGCDDDPTLPEGVMSVNLGPAKIHVPAVVRNTFSRIGDHLSTKGSRGSTATRDELEKSANEPVPGQRRLLAHLPQAVISSDD